MPESFNNIRRVRRERGLTLEQLSALAGVSYSALSKYERGERQPKIETLQKLASALHVDVRNLQGFTSDKQFAVAYSDWFGLPETTVESALGTIAQNVSTKEELHKQRKKAIWKALNNVLIENKDANPVEVNAAVQLYDMIVQFQRIYPMNDPVNIAVREAFAALIRKLTVDK